MPMRCETRLSEKEKIEFDSWGAEQIEQSADRHKLQKAAEYYRQQGFPVTADAVERRLANLTKGQPVGGSALHSDTVEVRASIESFQAELKQRSRLASQPTRLPNMQQELHAPVRGAFNPKRTSKGSAQENEGSAALRLSLDLLDEKDQHFLGSGGLRLPSQGTEPKPAAPTAGIPAALAAAAAALGLAPDAAAASHLTRELQQQAQQEATPLVQELKPKGAKRTQQLVEQNKHLPKPDRLAWSERKRSSGNDYFRAGAYADAIEEYTLAVALNPADTACYTNRAASYLKLKEWQAAVADCDIALMLLEGSNGPEQQLKAKALLRRAEAHVGLASHSKALEDYEAVLSLAPDEPRAQQGAAAARAALGLKPGMRRMAVVETDDSSSVEDDEGQQQVPPPQQQAPAAPDRQPQRQQQQHLAAATYSAEQEQQLQASGHDQVARSSSSSVTTTDASADGHADEQLPSSKKDSNGEVLKRGATAADPIVTAAEPHAAHGTNSSRHHEGIYQFTALPARNVTAKSSGGAAAAEGAEGLHENAQFMAELQEAIDYMASLSKQAAAGNSANQLNNDQDPADDAGSEGGNSSSSSSNSSSFSEAEAEALADFELDEEQFVPQDSAELVFDVPPSFEEQLTQLKDAGNTKFKAKAYSEAVALYSKALQHAPDATLVYVNRAMASLELNRLERAHEDSSIAIALQPDNFKAYHKRSKAKQGLKDYLGAQSDLKACIQCAPKSNKKLQGDLQAELKQLQQAATAAMAEERAKANAAQGASVHSYGSCVIEEVTESPEEIRQRLYEELQSKEQSYARQAAKCAQAAAQKRAEYQQQRQQKLEQQQHRLQALQEQQQRHLKWQQVLAEQAAQLTAKRAKRKAERDARRKAKADSAAVAAQRIAGSSSSSAAVDILLRNGGKTAGLNTAAVAAEPPTPPASPFDSKLTRNMAAAHAARAAAHAAATARGAAAATADGASPPCSTPAATPLNNATPAATPAGSFIAASTLLQRHTAPTPEQIEDQVAAEVEALKDKGNALLQQGKLEDAEAAYQEALQLDGDNVKVLLNLALLRLKQEDGAGAVRCCEEVLAQQDVPELARLKALVRHGLGLELLGECAEALAELSAVAEQNNAAGRALDEQLARDIARVAEKVQQQHHAQQQEAPKLDAESTATALKPAAVNATTRSTKGAQQQQHQHQSVDQQQQRAAAAITGMRASIHVVSDSDDSESEQEAEPARKSTVQHSSSSTGDESAGNLPCEAVYTAAAADTNHVTEVANTSHQQQQQQDIAEAAAAGAPASTRLEKVAVVFESDSESSDVEDADSASQQQQQAPAGTVASSPAKTEEVSVAEAAAAKATAKQLLSDSGDEQAAASDVPAEAASAQQQERKLEDWRPLQRSGSAGAADAEQISVATSACLSRMSKLLENTAYSPARQLQRAGSSGSHASSSRDQDSSSSDSSNNDVLHWDPFAPDVDEPLTDKESLAGRWERLISARQQQERGQQQQRLQQQEEERVRQLALEASIMQKLDAAEADILPGVVNIKTLQKADEQAIAIWQQQFHKACTELAQKASSQRAAGEAALHKGSPQLALKHYNAAAAATPKDPLNYAGRAVVWMKLKRWQHAEEDLTAVLVLAAKKDHGVLSKYTAGSVDAALMRKVRQRRALVWKELGRVKEAIAELKKLLAENASDSSLQRLVEECKQLYAKQLQQAVQIAQQQQQKQEVESSAAAVGADSVSKVLKAAESASPAAATAPEPVSQVQRHTIIIEETDGSESEESEEEQEVQVPVQQHRTAQQEPLQKHQVLDASDMHRGSRPAGATVPKPAVAGSAAAGRVLQQLAHKQYAAPARVADFVNTAKTLLAAQQPASTTNSTADGQQTLGQYVRLFEPSQYRAVFKTELNQEILRYLVSGYQAIVLQEPDFVAKALLALSKVERFSLVLPMACVNKCVKNGLQRLLQQLEEAGQGVSALKVSYNLALK